MSVELSSGNYLSRTGGVPASHQAFSCCAWIKRSSDAALDEYVIHFGTGTNPIQIKVEHDDNLFKLNLQYSGSRIVSGPTATVDSWFFIGLVCSGSTATMYWRSEGETSLSSGSASNTGSDWTTDNIYLGRDATTAPSNPFDGLVACFRVWDAALTVGEMQAESESLTAVKTASLLSDHRFDGANIAAAVEDDHTSNNDFTATGTVTVSVDEPTVAAGGGAEDELAGGDDLPVIASIDLAPTAASLYSGDEQTMIVTINDQDDVGIPYLEGVAASDTTSVATVVQPAATNASGEATFLASTIGVGTASITVALDGVTSNAAVITVAAQPVSGVVIITPPAVSLAEYGTQQFTAEIEGATTGFFGWSVESGTGSIDSSGLFTASVAGTTTIRATYSEDTSIYAEATITVIAASTSSRGIVTSRPWKNIGVVMSGINLDYWIISAADQLIASGSGTTDSTGKLSVVVGTQYVGQSVNMVVNNLSSSMETSGKFHGQQVITVI